MTVDQLHKKVQFRAGPWAEDIPIQTRIEIEKAAATIDKFATQDLGHRSAIWRGESNGMARALLCFPDYERERNGGGIAFDQEWAEAMLLKHSKIIQAFDEVTI